jgi:hypothetical protein
MRAFDQVGGVEYLTTVARTHPQVFCALLGKVLPRADAGRRRRSRESQIYDNDRFPGRERYRPVLTPSGWIS